MRLLNGILTVVGAVILIMSYAPLVHAEQGYGFFEFAASKPQVNVGEEFSVAIYVTGRENSQFGKVTFTVETWMPGDPNPKGYEFVRFDASNGDFPIAVDQRVDTGVYNYQCRHITRQASADMTGRHLFGRAIFRATDPGSYAFMPSLPCTTVIESLTGNWGFIWDYGNAAYFTVNKPSTQPNPPANTPNQTPAKASGTKPVSATVTQQTSPASTKPATTNNITSSPTTNSTPEGTAAAVSSHEQATTAATNATNPKVASVLASNISKQTNKVWLLPLLMIAALSPLLYWKRQLIRDLSRKFNR